MENDPDAKSFLAGIISRDDRSGQLFKTAKADIKPD